MKRSLSASLLILAIAAAASAQVNVYISSPSQGSTRSNPVHVTGMATAPHTISAMIVYVDNKEVYRETTNGKSSLSTYVSIGGGSHYAYIKAWDTSGASGKSPTVKFTVSGTSTTSSSTSSSSTSTSTSSKYSLDEKSGWIKCGGCSSVDLAPGWLSQYQSSPSMDGKSMHFSLGGTTPYRNSLWYKNLGYIGASHFVYDLYFYIKTPGYSEALEFDINQYIGGRAYVFGNQCSPKWSHQWDIYDKYNHRWVHTGISCPVFPGYKWNHVQIEVARTPDHHLHYVSVTFNGVKHYVNKYLWSTGSSWNGTSVDFQMDGDSSQHDYSTWLDKVKLTYW